MHTRRSANRLPFQKNAAVSDSKNEHVHVLWKATKSRVRWTRDRPTTGRRAMAVVFRDQVSEMSDRLETLESSAYRRSVNAIPAGSSVLYRAIHDRTEGLVCEVVFIAFFGSPVIFAILFREDLAPLRSSGPPVGTYKRPWLRSWVVSVSPYPSSHLLRQ